MKIRILDALGVKTGIRIDNVRAEYDDSKEEIKIFGRLYKMENFSNRNRESVVMCDFVDRNKRIIYCQKAEIYGDIDLLDKITFSIIIKEYSLIDWEDTLQIFLYII